MPRRFASILLTICFLAFGSGAMQWVHAQAHAMEDHANSQRVSAPHPHQHDSPCSPHDEETPPHDETNCDLHALLRAPIAASGSAPILISAGDFIGVIAVGGQALVGRLALTRVDCRGPPRR